ncbi:helix-turn-helix domain-containing protein [Candidatus Uhrbacteria bacterium]|jgi:transcriptional regulator with XRE-family HTH domain|nr:helix-turn-helix domain-containing protein [Candidatus Uhrbacteria bacterium]
MSSKLATQLKHLRTQAGLSQNMLAQKADISASFINKLEAGEYSTLSLDKSRSLAKALQMTFHDFLEAIGMLEDSKTPNADMALASALRKRGLTDSQVDKTFSFIEFIQKDGK